MRLTALLPNLLHTFFHDWLIQQCNASRHTVLAYRDSWRLFLRFVARNEQQPVASLTLSQLTASQVLAFLHHLEQDRGVSIATRNCRLAALRSFFIFLADCEPAASEQCAAVLRIPTKRSPKPTLCYLEVDEVSAIITQTDLTTTGGQRDHALLTFLYNTGARIQEALDVCPNLLQLQPPPHVRLNGKGRKERICPLWTETANILKALLDQQPRAPFEPIFCNRYGRPLTASGVRYRLRQYVDAAAHQVPTLRNKRVSPHTFRHTTAVHLIAAGVDITVIRSWLGHSQLETTNLYAQANLDTKRKALEQFSIASKLTEPVRWKRDDGLLDWLESL